jgi:NitT/TauT family transport system permease protein
MRLVKIMPNPPRLSRPAEVDVWIIRLAFVAVVLSVWELAAAQSWLNPIFAGRPSVIAQRLVVILSTAGEPNGLWVDVLTTAYEAAAGFIIGTVVGFSIGFAFALYGRLRRALEPLTTVMNSLPRIAFAPLFIIWFGIGPNSKIALVVSLVIFIVLLNTLAGLTQTDRDFLLLARSLGADGRQRLMKFVLPAAVPTLAAALQLALVYSFLGAVGGEIFVGARGLGVLLATYANRFQTNDFFATLIILASLTTLASWLINRGVRRLLWWHYIEMGPAGGGASPPRLGRLRSGLPQTGKAG